MSNNLFNGHHEHSNEPKSNILSQDNEFTNIRRSTGSCIHLRTRVDYQQILRSKAGFALVCHRHVGESEINKAWKKKWISFKGIHLQFCKNQDSPVQWRIPLHLIKEIWTGGRKSSFNILALETEFLFQVEEQEVSNWFFAFQTQIAAYMEDLIKSNIEEETNFLLDIKWWRVKENALVSSLGSTSSPFSSTKKILPPMTQTELYSWVYNDQLLSAAVHSSQNTRKTMEDRHVIVPSINEKFSLSNEHGKNYSFFGVFDGHGGVDAAHFIKDNLLTNIFSQSSFFSDLNDAIIKGVSLTDSDFLDFAQAENITCGSTACFGFLGNGKLTIANIGDSRAVISKSKTATPLSDDHKPNRFDEMDRIIKAGGTVDCCQEMNVARLYELNPLLVNEVEIPNRLAQLVGFNEVYRIQKEMSVSRSIGDRDFKYPYCKDIWEETECSGDLVISIPEIVTYNLDGSDEFLIIACDVLGLWDVFNNQAAVDFVHMKLKQFPDQYLKVSTLLAEEAIKLGSQDNISVLVLFFGSKKDIEIEEIETHKIPNQLKLSGIRKKKSNLQGNSSETIQPLSPHLLHPHSSPQSLTPSYTPTPNSLSKSTPAKKGDKIVDMPRSGSLPGVTQLPIINDKNSNNNNNNNNSNNNNNNNNNNNDDQLSNISTSCEITNSSTTNETTMSQEKNSTIEPTPTNTSNSHSTPSPAKSRSLRDTRKKLSSSHDPRNNNNNNNNNDDNNNSDMK